MTELVHHTVKQGEYLFGIAEDHGVLPADILRANPWMNNNLNFPLHPDAVLHVVIPDPEPEPEPQPEPEPEPEPEVEGPPISVQRLITVNYLNAVATAAPLTTEEFRPFWDGHGNLVKFKGTQDLWPFASFEDGAVVTKSREGRKGAALELKGYTGIPDVDKIYATWAMSLESGFSFGTTKFGGKLGGIHLGERAAGGSGPVEDGGSVRLNWRDADGQLSIYVYHLDQEGSYGDHQLTGVYIPVGDVFNIGLAVDVAAGQVKVYLNHQLVYDTGPGRYRWSPGLALSAFSQALRFGGNDNEFGPTEDSYSRYFSGFVSRVENI